MRTRIDRTTSAGQTLVGAILSSRPAAAVMALVPVPMRLVRRVMLADDAAENRRDAWDRLRHETERYAAVRAAVERYAVDGFVVDVGCSQGILADGLRCRRYLGVDRYGPAIELARHASAAGLPADRSFEVGDAEDFVAPQQPDAIVLNEVVYYLRRPVEVVEHHAGQLTRDGVVVLSIYARSWSSRRLLRALAERLELVESSLVTAGHLAWTVAVYRPRGSGGVRG